MLVKGLFSFYFSSYSKSLDSSSYEFVIYTKRSLTMIVGVAKTPLLTKSFIVLSSFL